MYFCDTYLRTRKCKFILEYESGKFTWKRVSGHFPSSYPLRGIARGTAAYFIPTVFQNRYSKMSDGSTLWNMAVFPIVLVFNGLIHCCPRKMWKGLQIIFINYE